MSDPTELDAIRKAFGVPEGLGATGRFPRGKIHESDEGEIVIAVAADPKTRTVILDFGKPIAMLGLDAEQATAIGEMLIDKAMALRGIESPK